MTPNLDLAQETIGKEYDLHGMTVEVADRLNALAKETGNHFFEWGAESYSSWGVDSVSSWVAELAPVVVGGMLVDYSVVFIEQVE